MRARMLRHRAAVAARANATALRLSLLWAAVFFPVGLHLPYFPVWLASRGLSDGAIAAALAVPPVLRVLVTPLVARAADLRGIAGVLAICAGTVLAGYCALAATSAVPFVFALAVLTIVAQGSMSPLADALTLSDIRRFERLGSRRIDYGRMRVCASASVLIMMLCSGPIVAAMSSEGIVRVLVAMAIAPVIVSIIIARRTHRLRPVTAGEGGKLIADPAQRVIAVTAIAAAALIQASHAEIYAFGTLQWRAAGFSPPVVGLAWALGVAAEFVLFLTAGRYVTTPRRAAACLALGGSVAALRWTAMAAGPPPVVTLFLQLLHGFSFAATYLGSVLLLGRLAGPNHRARIQGWLAATSSFGLAGSTLAAGYLTPLAGARAYLGMAALAAIGLMLALCVGRLVARPT